MHYQKVLGSRMQQPTKRLGELLVESGLITPAQLQSAITHQKIARGRLGSNLVALGYITEEILMDFLSHQTGVPQMDVRNLEVPPEVLKLVPYRLADQFSVLPISIKEPKSLVLAMSDPSDLNAVDSARFASGLHILPVVASYSELRKAIGAMYRRAEGAASAAPLAVGTNAGPGQDNASLPATLGLDPGPVSPLAEAALPHLESYQTRTLVLGLIRLFQRRGMLGHDELQRLLASLIESGQIKDDDKIG